MLGTAETRDLARHLLAFESSAGRSSAAAEPATLCVYEKLRGNLCVIAGAAGFQSLASRALTLTSAQVPGFRSVQVADDGKLQGISEMNPPIKDWNDQNGVILISILLELLFMFLGKALTMNLIRNAWPDEAFDNGSPRDGRKA